jgi:hypothetical protein
MACNVTMMIIIIIMLFIINPSNLRGLVDREFLLITQRAWMYCILNVASSNSFHTKVFLLFHDSYRGHKRIPRDIMGFKRYSCEYKYVRCSWLLKRHASIAGKFLDTIRIITSNLYSVTRVNFNFIIWLFFFLWQFDVQW